ncbi:hypothetical protein CDL15_Pgr001763 [Punica granatum]|uniref:AB hydrolase-1 domain-containing protein n=1 Tax=Punica granatum TaxID=22663 RepID=A0A218XBW4_PUNGR|nr:hypothetical protein CDL15_Pgr001763 [Punica granatum]PKI39407.1 hypothetical protein CRG98_040165 [Punica granatum]
MIHRPPKAAIPIPSCIIQEFVDEIITKNMKERTELIHAFYENRTQSDLPRITRPTPIIWGEYDQIFPIELAHRLKRHLGGNERVELVIIKDAGHVPQGEKPLEQHQKAFLTDSLPRPDQEKQSNSLKTE